jgi:hypothetical protein
MAQLISGLCGWHCAAKMIEKTGEHSSFIDQNTIPVDAFLSADVSGSGRSAVGVPALGLMWS